MTLPLAFSSPGKKEENMSFDVFRALKQPGFETPKHAQTPLGCLVEGSDLPLKALIDSL